MSTRLHLLLGAALVVNLLVGGALIAAYAGEVWRGAFEFLLILAYLHFAWGFPGRLRTPSEEGEPPAEGRRGDRPR